MAKGELQRNWEVKNEAPVESFFFFGIKLCLELLENVEFDRKTFQNS